MITAARLRLALKTAMPKNRPYRVVLDDTGIAGTKVVRVVTPAWKSLPRFQRAMKVQHILDEHLPKKDLARIFRVSVLTAEEFDEIQKALPQSLSGRPRARRQRPAPRVSNGTST
jgi:hypothetical protein